MLDVGPGFVVVVDEQAEAEGLDEVFRAAEELGIDLSRREPSSVEEV